jgi:hypothetical protein
MYSSYGAMSCAACHNGTSRSKAPILSVKNADMKQGVACSSCHSASSSSRSRARVLFISLMNDRAKTVYTRCSNCHTIASDGGWSGGSGGGGYGGGGWGGDNWGRR